MNKLFIASNNEHKINEIKDILKRNKVEYEIFCPKDFNDHDEPEENGKTFQENAYIKAKYYFDKYKMTTLADDSGICIDFFDGGPGIHSARFLSSLNYSDKNDFIIYLMRDTNNRKATFVDCLCMINENGDVSYYEGKNEGSIAYEQKGSDGFGYDPIFVIPKYNKTEAELGQKYKNEHSHRAKALKMWIEDVK